MFTKSEITDSEPVSYSGCSAASRHSPKGTHMNLIVLKAWINAKFRTDERGASMVEYALLVALIAGVCIVAVTAIGTGAKTKFSSVSSSLN